MFLVTVMVTSREGSWQSDSEGDVCSADAALCSLVDGLNTECCVPGGRSCFRAKTSRPKCKTFHLRKEAGGLFLFLRTLETSHVKVNLKGTYSAHSGSYVVSLL